MKKFKKFIKNRVVGFASIHKKDTSDNLLIITPKVPAIGFGSIHRNDDSDKLLKKLKEDLDLSALYQEAPVEDTFHKEMLKVKPHVGYGKQQPTHEATKNSDAKEFAHHHARNLVHKAEEGIKKHADKVYGGHQPHNNAIGAYTEGSGILNQHLIHKHYGTTDSVALKPSHASHDYFMAIHDQLSKETHHSTNALKKPTIVHSGTGQQMGEILHHHTKIGETVHFPAYTSTTTDYDVAKQFSRPINGYRHKVGNYEQQHIMHFHLPKGYTKGRHVRNISDLPSEHEMILHHGQTFRKVGHHVENMYHNLSTQKNVEVHHHHLVPHEE